MPKGKSAERRKRVIVTVDFVEGQMRRRKIREIYTVRKTVLTARKLNAAFKETRILDFNRVYLRKLQTSDFGIARRVV
jgi:outer membrane lipoprotein-sorting protein